nr:hypothetical protein [Tanacetum cinerariifolium]
LNDQKLRKKATNQMEKFFQIFQDLHFDISFADALLLMPKFASTIKSLLTNKDKLFELGTIPLNENCSAMLLKKLPKKLGDPGKFLIPCDFPRMDPPEVELKDLPSCLEYAYLEKNDRLPVIISKDLKDEEKEALLNVLKSHKRAIAWKITDVKGIDPQFWSHKILMEEDFKPSVQIQRRVNPKIHEVIKKEVLKLFNAGMIYLISDSSWVSPIHCVPKKGGINVVAKEENELILTRNKISKSSLEVDRAKVDVIAKLPHPTTVKGVRSFLRHAGFYRRFIQDFSKIARPMTHLLEKETPFVFSKDCINAFETLKKKLTEAPILVVPDWNLPFELMCDASDFTIGAVLGQRVCMAKKPLISSKLVMKDPPEAIMVLISPRKKYLMPSSFGLPYIEMLIR